MNDDGVAGAARAARSDDQTSTTRDIDRRPFLALACLALALHAVLAWLARAPSITTGGDDGEYVVLARALRHLSYANLEFVGAPPHAKFPPLYPALLAILGVTGADDIGLAIAANVLLSVGALALLGAIASRWSRGVALSVLFVCAPAPLLIELAGGVFSEPLFLVAIFLPLWLLTAPSQTRVTRALAGAAIIGAAFVRTAGVAFVLALFVEWLIERRWRAALTLAAASAVTLGAWLFWTVHASTRLAGSSYLADAVFDAAPAAPPASATAGVRPAPASAPRPAPTPHRIRNALLDNVLVHRVSTNVPRMAAEMLPQAFGVATIPGTRVDNVAWLLLLVGAGCVGAWVLWRRFRVVVLFAVAYGALLAAWPYTLTRFLAPLLGPIMLALTIGVGVIANRIAMRFAARATRAPAIAHLVVALALCVSASATDVRRLRLVSRCDRTAPLTSAGCFSEEQRGFFAATLAARSLVPATSIVLVSKPSAFHLLTGLGTVRVAEAAARPGALASYVRARGVDYILLSRVHLDQSSLERGLRDMCRQMTLVGRYGPHVSLLRVAPPRDAQTDACTAVDAWAAPPWSTTVALLW